MYKHTYTLTFDPDLNMTFPKVKLSRSPTTVDL
jgi:hypothetical protein